MKKLRVLVLMHEDLVPPVSLDGYSEKEIAEWATEYDVVAGLQRLGHEVYMLGVGSDLGTIRNAFVESRPHIAFNLMVHFHGVAVYDQHVVSYIELLRKPYTGCNPRGMMLARDKALSKEILSYHRIRVPKFHVFPVRRKVKRPRRLEFPLVVKSINEEASLGISQASVVTNDEKLKERVEFMHETFGVNVIVEEYIDGRELYVGVIGNQTAADVSRLGAAAHAAAGARTANRHRQGQVGSRLPGEVQDQDATRRGPLARPRRPTWPASASASTGR